MLSRSTSRGSDHAFISTHTILVAQRKRPVLFSLRKSTFNISNCFRRASRRVSSHVTCSLQSSEDDGQGTECGIHLNKDSSRKYFATYESWRNPTWLRSRDFNDRQTSSQGPSNDSQPFLDMSQPYFSLKVSCSVALLSIIGFLGFVYVRLNTLVCDTLHTTVASAISRDLSIGRVVRYNPITGIKLRDVSVAPSAEYPTAPVISATDVDISLSGLVSFIFSRRPLLVNVRLDGAEIRVSQIVVDGPKHEPVGQWDPSFYLARKQDGIDEEVIQTLFKVLKYLQLGSLSVRNAQVFLQPADFLEYGHGSEVVEIREAKADVRFPRFMEAEGGYNSLIEMDGDFIANASGTPIEGGSVQVQCQMSGNALRDLKPEDPIVNLHVVGEKVRANRVASFLSLPFRADNGVCSADINMDFLYKSSSLVPLMRGEGQLHDVGLRFHPDPKTPTFQRINGKLRFEGKSLFLDGPVGELGTLPMTVVGDIHLEDGYNLMGYVRPVDMNNIIDTFDLDKFVPVEGLAIGEAQLSGSLEEPIISGWAESVGQDSIFDRLPLTHANVSFKWDAIAGMLNFSEIEATVKGGGSINGSGSIFFDMTKESPYGISQTEHSPRSPKYLYWNPRAPQDRITSLSPLPQDPLEIDEHAPFRPYDSMRFDFKATDVSGGDLVKAYGGEHGQMASEAIGLVSGEGILAGNVEDANCRVAWRSTTPPPVIHLNLKDSELPEEEKRKEVQSRELTQEEKKQPRLAHSIHQKSLSKPLEPAQQQTEDVLLGGGDFRGLVYIKLGDLPDARRVKVRTIVKNLDARRLAWADPELRKSMAHVPFLKVSMDTYFKGVMSQRPNMIPGQVSQSRTPRMELVGVDGALAVKNLTMNKVKFEKIMSGSFSFSVSDFSLSLREVLSKVTRREVENARNVGQQGGANTTGYDELTLTASVKGAADFSFRQGNSEVIASVSQEEQNTHQAVLFVRNFAIEDVVGGDIMFSSGNTLSGVVNANMKLDLSSRRGDGNVSLENPRIGPLNFSSVTGNLVWRDQDLYLDGGTVKYRRSVYEIEARYDTSAKDGGFEWEVNVNIPRASIQDVATLVQSGNDVATAMQSPTDKISQSRQEYSGGPLWIQKLSRSGSRKQGTVLYEWEVPETLTFSDQLDWFHQYLEEKQNIAQLSIAKAFDAAAMNRPSTFGDVDGNISGRVTLKYNSSSSEVGSMPSSASAILQAILDQLTRTSFSFQLNGTSWRVGPSVLEDVKLVGTFEDGVLNVGPLTFNGGDGFGAEALGRITNTGSVKVSAKLRKAPADLVNRFSQAPVNVKGECNGRIEVEGSLSNPRAFGRVVWTSATLNEKQVRGAKTDFACINGRCILNADARVGGRKVKTSEEAEEEAVAKTLQWGEGAPSGLTDLASQVSRKDENTLLSRKTSGGKGQGETLQVRISAPVRFYLLKYLKRRASSSFWSNVQPVLGGSLPSDDNWILMDVDVKKYGLVLLNTAFPELGWESGDSDIKLRVSGTLAEPVVEGKISLWDGRISSSLLSEPLQGVRGEIEFRKTGLVSMRSVSGRCAGKWFNASGDIFFSELHRDRLSEAIAADHIALQLLEAKNSGNKKQRRLLQNRQSASNVALLRGRRGLSLEFGEFPVNFQNIVLSKLSGKVQMAATLANPVVSGGLTFSDGFISLGNAAGVPRGALGARTKNAMVRKVPPTADMSLKDENHLRGREKSETDENINLEASTELTTQDKLLPNGDASILLSGLRINIGRGMKVIQPLVLNLDTTGTLVLEGSPQAPQIEGEIRLLRGRVNLLATRMSIRKDAKNYVRFVKSDETSPSTAEDSPEPLINATLESERLLVRIPECRLSKWAEHLEVTDRSGDQMSGATWDALVQSELKELRNPEAAARLFAKYAFQAVEAGGKAGKLEWRVFPALVKKNDGKSGKLKDEIGAGAEVEVGGLAIGGKRSVDGTVGGKVRLRLRDWLSWEVEQEGAANTRTIKLEVDLTPKRWNENIDGDREADASNTNEGQSDRQKRKDKKGTTRLQGDTGPDKEESKKEGAGAENTHKGPSETKVVTEGTSTAEKERVEDTKLGRNDASEGVTSKDEKTIDSENASKGSGK